MTDYRMHEMRELCDILEAEATGRPFDRARARSLADVIARHHPEIGNTMRLMTERLHGALR